MNDFIKSLNKKVHVRKYMKIRLALYFSTIIIILATFGISTSLFLNSNSPLVYGMESSNYSTVENKLNYF